MKTREFTLNYGRSAVSLRLPEGRVLHVLEGRERPALADLPSALREALEHPVDAAPLREIVKPDERVVIAVSDITRGWQRMPETLPPLLDALNEAGVPDERMTILIAVGAHRMNTPEEFQEICGAEVCHRVRVLNHDARDPAQSVYLGKTSRGTPVAVNRIAVEADRLILTGGVIYHYMVGYGGGRKSIMPGICAEPTIQASHLWSMDPQPGGGRSRLAQSGITDGNPAHEDMMECASLVPPDFIVNVVPNLAGRICGVFAGNWVSAWRRATRQVDEIYGVEIRERADIVIATAGGYPKDINLYQTTKTMDNAVHAAREGGACVILSECADIREPLEYFRWFDQPSIEEHDRALRAAYTIAGWCALITREYCRQCPTILLTRPENAAFARRAGLIPASTIEEALALARERCGRDDPTYTVLPNGANTLPLAPGAR